MTNRKIDDTIELVRLTKEEMATIIGGAALYGPIGTESMLVQTASLMDGPEDPNQGDDPIDPDPIDL